MKFFIALMCCLTISMAAYGANEDGSNKKKKGQGQGQGQQQAQQVSKGGKQGKHGGTGQGQGQGQVGQNKGKKGSGQGNFAQGQGQGQGMGQGKGKQKGKQVQGDNLQAGQGHKGNKFEAKKFKLANKPNPNIESVKFQKDHHIEGSEHWNGEKYVVFRNYHSEWHDHDWWHHNHNRIILISGGWYFWNAGFWFPAWGYDPGQSYYPYDGPIYGYRGLPPDQVVANVQSALQQQGYYHGEVDGQLGPVTRAALADYQRDQGLTETAAVDEPTLDSLGMS